MEHDAASRSLEITHHIFLDDLEEALRKVYDPKLDIVYPGDKEKRDEYIKNYIMEHFSVKINGKLMEPTYIGHEIEEDALYAYIEIKGVRKLNEILVRDNLLTELFDDQINLVHIKVDGKIRSLKLGKKNDSGQISYTD